jgi:hypothetical protein
MINQFLTNEYTEVIQKLIREVVNDPSTYRGAKYLPSIAIPVKKIRTEVVEASGGLTLEHVPGTQPKYIQSFGARAQEYDITYYKEAIHYDEAKLLYIRELGNNGRNARGVRQFIDLDIDRLNRRLEARIEFERWQAILTGAITFMGNTFSFNIPTQNTATPIGATWSTDGVNPNPAANPIKDIRYWVMGGYAPFRKYIKTALVMNPNTARWILDNPNTLAYLTSYGANAAIKDYDLNTVLSFLIPGCPKVDVYEGWYQTETIGTGTPDTGLPVQPNQIVVSNATYFIPDRAIYFECKLPGGDKIGEFVQGINLASGTIDNPGFGKFLVVDDCTAPGTRGGPSNPFVDLIGGVYGGAKLDRAFDTLTASV